MHIVCIKEYNVHIMSIVVCVYNKYNMHIRSIVCI